MSGSAEEVRKHIATYKKIAAALGVGTIVTVLASYLDVSVAIGITIALVIATTKASLVANYFMHLGEERSQWLMVSLGCLLYTSPSPRDRTRSRMPSSA